MLDLARRHKALAEDYRWHLQIAAGKLLAQPNWSLEATVALIDTQAEGVTIGPVGNLSGWLDHAPPAFDAFVRLQNEGVSFEDAYQRCLTEQGQEFLDACDFVKTHRALVTHDNLAEFAALSQKGFAVTRRSCWCWPSGPTRSRRFWCRVISWAELRIDAGREAGP